MRARLRRRNGRGGTGSGTTGPPPVVIRNLPAQWFSVSYGNGSPVTSGVTGQYARPGGLVIANSNNLGAQVFKDVSAGGGTVLCYIDAIVHVVRSAIDDTTPLHRLLYIDSPSGYPNLGAGATDWPGNICTTGTTGTAGALYLSDFRVGSTMHTTIGTLCANVGVSVPTGYDPAWTKLEAVLEYACKTFPHLGGFFLDDCGTRSTFPNLPWSSVSDQSGYRLGAVEVTKAANRVNQRHSGLMVVVNGVWEGGTLSVNGGGYPNIAQHGCSLADGGMIERHDYDGPGNFWNNYAASAQWSTGAYAQGSTFMLAIPASGDVTAWSNSNLAAYVSYQAPGSDTEVAPQGAYHATGLPSHA